MKRTCATLMLSLVLTTQALAGVVEMPGKTEPPPPPSTSTSTTTSGVLTQTVLVIIDLAVKR